MTNEIDEMEKLIDQTWENLLVYRLPLHLAVFMVLASFEHYLASPLTSRLPYTRKLISPIEITSLRQGLQELVPMLFKRCKATAFKYSHIKDLRNLYTPYTYAFQAMNYCQRYEWMAYHLTAYRQGWLECQVKGRVITFTPHSQADSAQSLMHHLLHQYREMRSRDQESLSKIAIDSPYEKITESLKKAIKHVDIEEFLPRIPNDVLETYRGLVLASAPSPTIERSASFGAYSIGEYHDFWVTLSALMISYLEANKIKYGNNAKRLMNSRVVVIHADDLANVVAGKCTLSYHLVRQIVQELIFNPSQQRPDIQIQPIIQIASDILFIAPHLIFTSNWEVCLFRYWAKISPGRYGEIVASKKDNLTDELADTIYSMQLTIGKRKKLFDQEGKPIGDVDLAIFDKSIGFLIIAQIKWVIEPDSFQDESHAKEELSKGIKQLRICQSLINENIEHFTSKLFDDKDVKHNDIKEVLYVLLSRGEVDCGFDVEKYNIHILDYVLSLDVIKSSQSSSIKNIFFNIIDMHNRAKKQVEKNTTLQRLKVSGYLLETQGIKHDICHTMNSKYNATSYPAKETCPCGSGIMYEDCCKILESYEEDVNSLQDDN